MKKQFGLSLFPPVGISAGLMTMLLLLMLMPSSTDGFEITVTADEKILNESNQITLVVKGSTTVKMLKEQIKKETGIPPRKHSLGLKNPDDATVTVLQGSETMTHYGIGNGTIVLLFINFEIKVTADEHIFNEQLPIKTNIITVEVNGMEKVEDFKQKIIGKMEKESKTKIGNDFKRLTLKYGENDDFLNDEKTINYYPIEKDGTVRLSIGEFQIVVREEIENEVKNYTIWVNNEETVAMLKKKIKNLNQIEPEEQTLTWTYNDQTLDDKNKLKYYSIESALKYYGIEEDATILLSRNFEITVKADEKITNESYQITVVVQGSTTVKELKEQIKKETGIPPRKHSLGLKNPDDGTVTVLQYSRTMTHYGIEKGTTILLFINFEIIVKVDPKRTFFNRTITLEVNGMDKVEHLKEKIMDKLYEKGITLIGTVPEILTLQHGANDDVLKDGKTIGYYHIKKDDNILHLSIGEFRVFVKNEIDNEMKSYTFWVKREETVATLKKKIKNESGIEPDDQVLKCAASTNGPALQNKKRLKDYGIERGTILILSLEFVEIINP
ncbi:hypothetical protein niasHS_018133 [Heterodera schachtii]|uniref:Ubiquitin-like domain-containing protein n=1 Tax=Heterodera schachtii TaxID=97005 RepID=A0ABD2I8C2_HETSC